MRRNLASYVTAVTLLFGAAPLFSVPEGSDLVGADVINKAGETLGTLKEFVFDQNSKESQLAVVESGGSSDMGAKLFLVPWEAFQMEQNAEDDTNRVTLDATADKLQGATEYDPDKPIPTDQVYAYWGITRQAQTSPQPEESSEEEDSGFDMPD